MAKPTAHQLAFVDYLCTLNARPNPNRAALAALRRSVAGRTTTNAEIHRYVARWIPEKMSQQDADGYYLVAALFGTHPDNRKTDLERLWRTNFGASFKRLDANERSSTERRFVALLNSHRDDLPTHLRHAVSLLRSDDIAVDWAQLLRDIQGWDHPERYVQLQWARSFWAPPRQDPDAENDTFETEAA